MRTAEDVKLKPCPFCGKNKLLIQDTATVFWVECRSYRCWSEGPGRQTEKLAIAAWNTRPAGTAGEEA